MKQTINKRHKKCRSFERELLRKIFNILCRCGMVIGVIALIGIWGGAEFGELLIGRRILWTVMDLLLICAAARGDSMTGRDPDGIL